MTFLPAPEDAEEDGEVIGATPDCPSLAQPDEEEELDEKGVPKRHTDSHLQTGLGSAQLQTRLLKVYYDAERTRTSRASTSSIWHSDFSNGSSLIRLTSTIVLLSFLCRLSSNVRAPTDRLTVVLREDISTNLSLKVKLKTDFGIDLPEIANDDDFSVSEYFASLSAVIASKPRWTVLPNDIVLWFFSFSKLLMYLDLDPDRWPHDKSLDSHSVLKSLLEGGFRAEPPIIDDSSRLDDYLSPQDMVHVMDADSSQAIAVEEVRRDGILSFKALRAQVRVRRLPI